MTKRKIPKFLLYILPLLFGLFIGLIVFNKSIDDEIQVSDISWTCKYMDYSWTCTAKFSLENPTHKFILGTAGVRGINRQKSKASNLNDLSEIAYLQFELEEKAKKAYEVAFTSKKKPKKVTVTIIGKE